MTLIDWTVIVTTKATITISISGRKDKDREGGW